MAQSIRTRYEETEQQIRAMGPDFLKVALLAASTEMIVRMDAIYARLEAAEAEAARESAMFAALSEDYEVLKAHATELRAKLDEAQQWRGLDTPPKPFQDVEIVVTQRATYEPGDDLDEPSYNIYYEDDIIIGWRPLPAAPDDEAQP